MKDSFELLCRTKEIEQFAIQTPVRYGAADLRISKLNSLDYYLLLLNAIDQEMNG